MQIRFRSFLFPLALVAILLVTACGETTTESARQSESSQAAPLVVVSFGGSFQEAQRQAYFEPFTQKTGIPIIERSYDGSYEKLRMEVASGAPNWDVVDVESAVYARGSSEGLFETIPAALTADIDMVSGARTETGIGANVYATLIGSRSGDQGPKDWGEFFDAKGWPGPRSLRRSPRGTLEFALLADGVAPSDLYPLDVDRAFKKLEELRSNIRVWWTSGQQPIDLLDKETVRTASVWSGRIWSARRAGKSIDASFEQALVETEYWVILKGSKRREAAEQFVQFTTDPKQQAKMAGLFGVGPTNTAAYAYIDDPETLRWLPSSEENRDRIVLFDPEWWLEHEAEVRQQWETWLSR